MLDLESKEIQLNLNPYLIFFFFNEKTLPYRTELKTLFDELEQQYPLYKFVPIEFEASKYMQFKLSDKIDPQLYISIMHADLVCRRLNTANGHIKNAFYIETFYSGKRYGFEYMAQVLRQRMKIIENQMLYCYTLSINRYLRHGNVSFAAFLSDVFEDNMTAVLEFVGDLSSIEYSTASRTRATTLVKHFFRGLTYEQKEQLRDIVNESQGYLDEDESVEQFNAFIHYKFDENEDDSSFSFLGGPKDYEVFDSPTIKIEVNPKPHTRLIERGDYDICIVKDNGENIPIKFKGKDDKMAYLLCLLCSTYGQGISERHFKDPASAWAIAEIYNKVYRKGGEDWVVKMKDNKHSLSQAFSNARASIKNLDKETAYWGDIFYTKADYERFSKRSVKLFPTFIVINDQSLTELASKITPLSELTQIANEKANRLRRAFVPYSNRWE